MKNRTIVFSKMINDSGIVIGIEHIKELYDLSINNINKNHSNLLKENKVIINNCDGRFGFEKYAPYKVIHVGASCIKIPDELIKQLDNNGRMFIPIGGQFGNQWIYLIDKDNNGIINKKRVLLVNYIPLTSIEKQLENYKKE